MNEMKKAQKEWADKGNKGSKKGVLSVISATITAERKKDDRWYLDSAAAVHVTHDSSLFISPDLNDDDIETIETASEEKIETRKSGTIDLEMTINDQNTSATISNVHYCPELDSNLILLGVLEVKRFEFRGLNDRLSVIDNESDVILQARRQNNVYSLNQLRHFSYSNGTDKALVAKKIGLDV